MLLVIKILYSVTLSGHKNQQAEWHRSFIPHFIMQKFGTSTGNKHICRNGKKQCYWE